MLVQKKWPFILAFAALGVSGWAAFLLVAMNQERLSSSVVRQVLKTAREDKALQAALGDAIRFEPTWYLNGDPWINGSVCVSFSFSSFAYVRWRCVVFLMQFGRLISHRETSMSAFD